jgi:hypothetical protein
MNEKLQQALGDLLNNTMSGISSAKDFLVSELPEVIQQLLMWHAVYNFILFVIALLFIINFFICGYVLMKKIKWVSEKKDDWGDSQISKQGIFGIVYGILSLVSCLVALTNLNFIWLKIWVAPKVWLIEYAANLVK